MDDLTLADVVLTLDDDIDTNKSNETHIAYDKPLFLRPRLVCGMTISLGKWIAIPRNRRWRNGMVIHTI
jgi:hypothetical protein